MDEPATQNTHHLPGRTPRQLPSCGPLAWALAGVVFFAFLWLNLDTSREAYIEDMPGGHQGGVRHGFPATLWDSGTRYALTPDGFFRAREYGGWQWEGLLVDGLALTGLLVFVTVVSEWLRRRAFVKAKPFKTEAGGPGASACPATPQSGAAGLRVPVRFATAIVLVGLSAAFVALNLRVATRLEVAPQGHVVFDRQMGWPVVFFSASGPYRAALTVADRPTKSLPSFLTSYEREELPGRAKWDCAVMVLDILIGLALASAAALGFEWTMRRRAARTSDPMEAMDQG